MNTLNLLLVLAAGPTVEQLPNAPAPVPPPAMVLPSPATPILQERAMRRCGKQGRSCHIAPGAGVVMDPKEKS